jgi:hypothetical protein
MIIISQGDKNVEGISIFLNTFVVFIDTRLLSLGRLEPIAERWNVLKIL